MYGDRKLVKTNRLKFKENDYLIEEFENYIKQTGQQSESVLREWFREKLSEVTKKESHDIKHIRIV